MDKWEAAGCSVIGCTFGIVVMLIFNSFYIPVVKDAVKYKTQIEMIEVKREIRINELEEGL